MKPIVKNFTGNFKCGTRYRVKVNTDSESLIVKLETQKNNSWFYQMAELESLTFGYEVALINALKKAQDSWGIKLLKDDLQKVA